MTKTCVLTVDGKPQTVMTCVLTVNRKPQTVNRFSRSPYRLTHHDRSDRMVQERRKAGLATLTDELETETAALGAALQEIGAASEVAIADAALKRAAGEI